jgi:hypothetical protein
MMARIMKTRHIMDIEHRICGVLKKNGGLTFDPIVRILCPAGIPGAPTSKDIEIAIQLGLTVGHIVRLEQNYVVGTTVYYEVTKSGELYIAECF